MTTPLAPLPIRFRVPIALAFTILLSVCLAISMVPAAGAKTAPKRIVTLTPFSADAMGLFRAAPRAVGEVLNTSDTTAAFSPFIENGIRSGRIKQLTLTHPNGPNLEKLARYNPKLVFSSPQWSKGTPAMKSLGITVKQADPKSLGQINSGIRMIGRSLGKSRNQANRQVTRVKRGVKNAVYRGSDRKKVMVILGVGRTPFTFLSNSWGGSITKLAGGNLLTGGAQSGSGFARISDEVVIAEDPDVIIAVPHAVKGDIPALIDYMKTNPAWSQTTAVTSGNLFVSDDNSLLQAGVNPGKVIRQIRYQYLFKN